MPGNSFNHPIRAVMFVLMLAVVAPISAEVGVRIEEMANQTTYTFRDMHRVQGLAGGSMTMTSDPGKPAAPIAISPNRAPSLWRQQYRDVLIGVLASLAILLILVVVLFVNNRRLTISLTERKQAKDALRESEELLSRYQEIAHTGSWKLDVTTNRLTWSDEVYRIFGCKPQAFAVTYEAFLNFVHPDDRAAVNEAYSRSLREGSDNYEITHRIVRRNSGDVRQVLERCVHERNDSGAIIQSIGMVQDITERKQAEAYREIRREILQILNEPGVLQESTQRVLATLKTRTGVDAVGLRLQDGEDFPYFVQDGFSKDFLLTENTLVERGKDGGVCRDEGGTICLECTCGLVISGKTDPSNPLFTQGGSCWTNDSFPLLDLPSDQDPRLHPRNNCIHQDYASVALIPIRTSDRIVGLIQLNDKHKGRFNLETIEILEGIAAHVGSALMRKRAEEKLAESEETLRDIVESTLSGFWDWNLVDNTEYLSPTFKRMFGYEDHEMESSPEAWQRLIFPEDLPGTLEVFDRHVKSHGREPFYNEIRYRHRDGSTVWVICAGRVIEWAEDGTAIRMAGCHIDITSRKQAEEAVATEKERLSVTLRSIGDGVITTDTSGRVVLMNKIAEELTGWKQEEALGKELGTVFKLVNELSGEPHENPAYTVLATGDRIELANHPLLISRDGSQRIIADSAAPIKDGDSHTIGVVLVFRDMTEKHSFLELTRNAQKLESLGILAGGIAHDFNNLMGGIYGCIEMAGIFAKDKNVSDYLLKAMSTINKGRDLTRQLLTFAKGGAPVQQTDHLFPFVKDTANFALSGSNISCRYEIPEDLWACNYDTNQIGQVIGNLVINAQQAMPAGGIIELSARNVILEEKEHPLLTKGNYVKIALKDNGIGMTKALSSKIFDPFFTTKANGQGLGLSTCYSIMSRHGGCIDVESEPGKGSTFTIYLAAVVESTEKETTTTGKNYRGSGTFLVMDDEKVMRETICDILKTLGFSVIGKENGNEVVELFTREAAGEISGMMFDLTVPGSMGGREAVEIIRKINRHIPVFVASGYSNDPVMKEPAKYGFTASICKPFRRAEIVDMLQKHMPIHHAIERQIED